MNEKIIGIEASGEIYPIKDEETSGKAQTLETKITNINAKLSELENIPRLNNFNDAVPEVGKTKVYFVNSGIGFGIVGQWRVESTLYDVTGSNQLRGCQRALSIDGVNVVEAIRAFYIDDTSKELRFGNWKQVVTG